MRPLKLTSTLFALLATAAVRADAVDDVIKASMAKYHLPGVAIGVIRDGKLVLSRGYGVANLETNTPVTPDTVFRIASMSKQFCAASILMLQAEGKLSIDDPVSKYIEGTPESWSKITLRQLLGHQSGIHDILSVKGFSFEGRWTQKSILALLKPLPLDFPPGDKFSYSNSGYYILGWIVEKISGQTLADFALTRIFRPAGMEKTSYFRVGDLIPNRANGYYWNTDHFENAWPTRPEIGDGSGAVLTTLGDWAKWDAALDVGAPLSKALQAMMGTAGTFNDGTKSKYGFGWYDDGNGAVHHTGSTHGFTSAFLRDPAHHITVVVMRNSNGGASLEMARDIKAAFLRTPPPEARGVLRVSQ